MPRLNHTGPEGQGPGSGRKLGECMGTTDKEKLEKLGRGRGLKRKSGGGMGRGKRLRSNSN